MGKLIVGNISSLNPPTDNTVTVDAGSRLSTLAEVRLNGQSFHPLPIPTVPNYFAQKFNPTDLYNGAVGPDGITILEPFGTTAIRATMSRDTSVTDSPAGGVPLKMVPTSANDPYTSTYNNSTWNIARAQPGETWTLSVYVKANTTTQTQIYLFEVNSAGAYTVAPSVTVDIGTTWQRVSVTRTIANASTVAIQTRLDGHGTSALGTELWFDGLMVEKSSTPSPWSGSAKPVVHPLVLETGVLQYNMATNRLEVVDNNNILIDTVPPQPTIDNPIGSVGAGGGFTVAEGAIDTNVINHTFAGMMTFQSNIRRNGAPTGNETFDDTANLRHPLEYFSTSSNANFTMHTGHSPTPWPQFFAIKVSNDTYGRVLNRIRWYKHTNAVGNVNIWGSNYDIDRSTFNDTTSQWTFIDRQHFGGSGSGGEGSQYTRPFTNTSGYRWYLLEMVDNNSSSLAYPNVGTQGGWAMYSLTFDKV